MNVALKTETEERRRFPRAASWKRGIIELQNKTEINCIVENISESGALLFMPAVAVLPKSFSLFIPDDNLELVCKRNRLDARRVAVEFLPAV